MLGELPPGQDRLQWPSSGSIFTLLRPGRLTCLPPSVRGQEMGRRWETVSEIEHLLPSGLSVRWPCLAGSPLLPRGPRPVSHPCNCPLSHPFRPVDGSSFTVLIPSYCVPPVFLHSPTHTFAHRPFINNPSPNYYNLYMPLVSDMAWMFVSPQNSQEGIISPKAITSGGGAVGGHVSRISAVMQEAPDRSQAPSTIGGPTGRCALQTENRPLNPPTP